MPIKWSALKVSEAAGMIEEFLNQAAEPLEQARIVAKEALNIADLPQYIEQGINTILSELGRVTGGEVTLTNYDFESKTHHKSVEHIEGSIKRAIQRLRDDIPADALKSDQASQKYGSTLSLV